MLYKFQYFEAVARKDKGLVVKEVLDRLKNEGYRFVQKVNGLWYPAPEAKARAKVIQALREFAFELRKEMDVSTAATTAYSDSDYPDPSNSNTMPSNDGASVVTMDSMETSLDTPTDHSSSTYDSWGSFAPESANWDFEPIPVTQLSSSPSLVVDESLLEDLMQAFGFDD